MSELYNLLEYLEDNDGYKNAHGVCVEAFDEGHVYISSAFKEGAESEVVNVAINNVFEEVFFIRLFKVKAISDLDGIKHEYLLRLYEGGLMDLTCLVEEDHLGGRLVFRKTSAGLLVIDAGDNIPHLADRDLFDFEDFVSYTSVYFLLRQVFWVEQGKVS